MGAQINTLMCGIRASCYNPDRATPRKSDNKQLTEQPMEGSPSLAEAVLQRMESNPYGLKYSWAKICQTELFQPMSVPGLPYLISESIFISTFPSQDSLEIVFACLSSLWGMMRSWDQTNIVGMKSHHTCSRLP